MERETSLWRWLVGLGKSYAIAVHARPWSSW